MPSCGCPDVKLNDGSIRACSCQPCSSGALSECSCNKETGCACTTSVLPTDEPNRCVCASAGKACSCESCACKTQAAVGACCS